MLERRAQGTRRKIQKDAQKLQGACAGVKARPSPSHHLLCGEERGEGNRQTPPNTERRLLGVRDLPRLGISHTHTWLAFLFTFLFAAPKFIRPLPSFQTPATTINIKKPNDFVQNTKNA